jgi:hypothetical protein
VRRRQRDSQPLIKRLHRIIGDLAGRATPKNGTAPNVTPPGTGCGFRFTPVSGVILVYRSSVAVPGMEPSPLLTQAVVSQLLTPRTIDVMDVDMFLVRVGGVPLLMV